MAGLAGIQERLRVAERRLTEVDNELATLSGRQVNEADVATALAEFDNIWDALAPREQIRVLELLIEQIEFNGHRGNMSITFRPTGIKTLTDTLSATKEDTAQEDAA